MSLTRHTRRTFLRTTAQVGAGSFLIQHLAWAEQSDDSVARSAQDFIARIAHDPNRPACHLLPPHNWMNDPNGPIWWKGKYHLFYQLNPHAAVWGDMHWGHAVSTDMVHWQHQPIALAPSPGGPDSEGCFSGSAVVHNGVPTFIYTGVQNAPPDQVTIHDGGEKLREVQMIATAEDDNLLHWKKQEQPVIATPPASIKVTGFRDPCPWKEDDGWYLAVGSGERGKGGCVLLYRSQDLRTWEYLHPLVWGKPNGKQAVNPCDSGEMWECPDFFPLGNRHCLLYSTENKVIWTTGHYDKQTHLYTPEKHGVLDRNDAYYAPKSFRAPDGRRILWGWIRESRPEAEYSAAGWAGVMSYPRVLTLGPTGQLEMRPAHEVESLRGPAEKAQLSSTAPIRRKLSELRQELNIALNLAPAVTTVRLLSGGKSAWELTIDVAQNSIRCGDANFPLPSLPWPHPGIRLFLDGSLIETFIGSREAITSRVYGLQPNGTELEISYTGKGRMELQTWPLKAISSNRLTT